MLGTECKLNHNSETFMTHLFPFPWCWDQRCVLSKLHRKLSVDLLCAYISVHRPCLHEYSRKNKLIFLFGNSFPLLHKCLRSALLRERGEPTIRTRRFIDPSSPPRIFSQVDKFNMAAARKLPETFRKLVITKLSTNYREAVESLTVPMLQPKPDELLLKNRWVTLIYSW